MTAQAPWIAGQTRQLLAQRGHAWLLQGPSGLGQYALALELARAWLCDQATPAGACGQCPSCHAIDVRAHTDLCVLMPETIMLERDLRLVTTPHEDYWGVVWIDPASGSCYAADPAFIR